MPHRDRNSPDDHRLTRNFYASEFDWQDPATGKRIPHPDEDECLRVADLLERIRSGLGGHAITVTPRGAYEPHPSWRSRASKRRKAPRRSTSQHRHGRAADFKVKGYTSREVYQAIIDMDRRGELPTLGGLGLYLGYVHADTRPRKRSGRIARWVHWRVRGLWGKRRQETRR